MTNLIRRTAHVLLVLSLLTACQQGYGARYRELTQQNRLRLEHLQLGMTREEVVNVMGHGVLMSRGYFQLVNPWRTEAFTSGDDVQVEIFFYRTEKRRRYKSAEDNELVPVVLENRILAGWGWTFVQANVDRYELGE